MSPLKTTELHCLVSSEQCRVRGCPPIKRPGPWERWGAGVEKLREDGARQVWFPSPLAIYNYGLLFLISKISNLKILLQHLYHLASSGETIYLLSWTAVS